MRLIDINEDLFFSEMKMVYNRFSLYFSSLELGSDSAFVSVIFDGKKFPFPLSVDIYKLWMFSIDKYVLDADEARTLITKIIDLFWFSLAKGKLGVEWQIWSKSLIGCVVRSANARLKLSLGENISAPELSLLSGMTERHIQKNALQIGGKRSITTKEYLFSPDVVKLFLAN